MTSYWDYLVDAYKKGGSLPGPGWGFLQAAYNMAYDNSHGDDRYWMSQWPVFSWLRGKTDSAKAAQDYYDINGRDPNYIQYLQKITGFNGSSLYGGASGATGIRGMSGSLSEMYDPEIVEDVGKKFNNMYG